MRTAALVLVVVVAVAAVAIAALRLRKLRHDQSRLRSRDAHATSAPPAPYEVSRGIRLLEPGAVSLPRPEPARPHLDPERPYVFSDTTPLELDGAWSARSRHDNRWALERSSHRSRIAPGSGRVLLIVLIALAVLFTAGAYLQRSSTTTTTTTTTTTSTTSTTSSTTTTLATH